MRIRNAARNLNRAHLDKNIVARNANTKIIIGCVSREMTKRLSDVSFAERRSKARRNIAKTAAVKKMWRQIVNGAKGIRRGGANTIRKIYEKSADA